MWWRSAVNLSFFRCLAACRTRSSAWDTLSRSCARCVLCWLAFPLAPALGSTGSAAVARLCSSASQLLWRSQTSHGRASSATAPRLPDADQCSTRDVAVVDREISRFPYKERPHMPGLRPRRAGWALALACPSVLPSDSAKASAPGMRSFSRLNSSAYAIPCQRFADILADACA